MRHYWKQLLAAGLLLTLSLFQTVIAPYWNNHHISEIIRDFAIMVYAKHKAGQPIAYEADYSQTNFICKLDYTDIETNSEYLCHMVGKIAPYFDYEEIVEYRSNLPTKIIWKYYKGRAHFHVIGSAAVSLGYININDRWYYPDEWQDERVIVGVVTHELIHLQGGNFSNGGFCAEKPFESTTVSATIEILAAMCAQEDRSACEAFWVDIRRTSSRNLLYRMRENGWLEFGKWLVMHFYGDSQDHLDKYFRHYENNFWTFDTILTWYGHHAWEDHILSGVLGTPMDTGIMDSSAYNFYYYVDTEDWPTNKLIFDDTRYQFGTILNLWINLLTKEGG